MPFDGFDVPNELAYANGKVCGLSFYVSYLKLFEAQFVSWFFSKSVSEVTTLNALTMRKILYCLKLA